jgi:hypothetical protein
VMQPRRKNDRLVLIEVLVEAGLTLSSNNGTAMSYSGVERVVTETTRSLIGVDNSPHMFRTSAASTAAIYAPENPDLGSAVLNHIDPTLSERRSFGLSGRRLPRYE